MRRNPFPCSRHTGREFSAALILRANFALSTALVDARGLVLAPQSRARRPQGSPLRRPHRDGYIFPSFAANGAASFAVRMKSFIASSYQALLASTDLISGPHISWVSN